MVILSQYSYDVFLSFRGEDTRFNFTDHLYKALVEARIETFLDDEEIQTGEELKPELERAIKESRSSVVVLSKNYASSTWCLNELVMILERRRTSGLIVFPVFYHVEPSEVRKQENSFGQALAKHEERIEAEMDEEKKAQKAQRLELWKEALSEVADLKAIVVKGHESKLIQEIVTEIDRRLECKTSSTLPQLIGMLSQVRAINSWLRDGSSNVVDILTICGISGIGKTTLAEYVYASNSQAFERSSFLEVGRLSKQPNGMLILQKQLLGDIRKGKLQEMTRVREGIAMIEKALSKQRVLIVLDDVETVEQMDELLGTKGFYPGSKIIITTKDRLLPKQCEVLNIEGSSQNYTEHLLKGLEWYEALKLLSWHAFKCNHPKKGYEEVSRKVVEYCGGHPLALKILGGSLLGKSIRVWEDTLKLLEKESDSRIQNILRVSFESLPFNNDKELFKHIACFFVGQNRAYIETILEGCDMETSSGISNLVDRCLLTIGPLDVLLMHQLLQEMGREMVRQESREKPWKRSRLWCHEESFHVLKEEKGSKRIQGLILDMRMLDKKKLSRYKGDKKRKHEEFLREFPEKVKDDSKNLQNPGNVSLKTDAFRKMDNLALLQLNFVRLHGCYENFPEGLRWLCWHGFPLRYLPSDLPMANLVALDLSYSKLKRLWKTPMWLGSLKILDLSFSYKLVRTGDLSGLASLENLVLSHCVRLVEICESIGELDRLLLLDLQHCKSLTKLPRNISKLKNLKYLLIQGCSHLEEFPIGMEDMESLVELNANYTNVNFQVTASSAMAVVPRGLHVPYSLVRLLLAGNNLVTDSFPVDFSSLSLLEHLDISENPIDCLPDCVRTLRNLKYLYLGRCPKLKSALCIPGTIKRLETWHSVLLEKITFQPEMSIQPFVCDYVSESLTEIHGIFKFQPLTEVDKEIISSLGWSDLELKENHEVQIFGGQAEKLPVQMFYEFGIFSTCFPGRKVPFWFTDISRGSSLSLNVPSVPMNHRICGLNLCFVHMFSGAGNQSSLTAKVSNLTKNLTWIYDASIWAIQEASDEGIVWLSHWMFGKKELEAGDQVSVMIGEEDDVKVSECGINLVYDDDDDDDDKKELEKMGDADPLEYYKSWKHIIGGDLSAFQLTTGAYFLTRDRYSDDFCLIRETFENKPVKKLVGDIVQYKDNRPWDEIVHGRNFSHSWSIS